MNLTLPRGSTVLRACVLALLYGAGLLCPAAEIAEGPVIVRIGPRAIRSEAFSAVLARERRSGDTLRVVRALSRPGRGELLSDLVEVELLALGARERGLDRDPGIAGLVSLTADRILANELLAHVERNLTLDAAALRAYFKAHRDEFRTPGRIHARQINVASREQAETALRRIHNGEDFAEIAAKVNIDTSRTRGGDLGWVVRGAMVKPFDDALFSLAEGEVSKVIQTDFGYHIVRAEALDPGSRRSFDDARTAVREHILDQARRSLLSELRKRYPVRVEADLAEKVR